ncbi:MAG: DUF4445 domain-containing protein [Clostridia bacterium]|nr:DUF4445 domain-containing protein [Clostridia bacterium]
MPILTIIQNNTRTQLAFEGTPRLRDVLIGGGFAVSSPCGGKGTCGKCTVQTESGKTLLSCQTILQGDLTVILPDTADAVIETSDVSAPHLGFFGAAVDVGTTTVVCKVFAPDGACVGERSCLNPQRAFASDVIGRIDASLRGNSDALQRQITDCIADLLNQTGYADQVTRMVVTGNTAMLYLLTGRCPASIARAPFVSETLFGETLPVLRIETFLPPCMDAFVGADITCAVLASGMTKTREISLLCDIGTNGELALWKNGVLYVTSTAAGPAFEGAEISSGCGGIVGAVDRVYAANGRVYAHTIGDKPVIGICGSGLIDAVAAFLQTGQIDETGAIDTETLPLTAHGKTVTLTQGDIRAVQLAKAAIAAGIELLLAASGTSAEEVARVCLAGGFGNKLSVESAVQIGLLPRAFLHKTVPIGNAALAGAVMLLSDEQAKQKAAQVARLSRHVQLGGNAEFNEKFVDHMMF